MAPRCVGRGAQITQQAARSGPRARTLKCARAHPYAPQTKKILQLLRLRQIGNAVFVRVRWGPGGSRAAESVQWTAQTAGQLDVSRSVRARSGRVVVSVQRHSCGLGRRGGRGQAAPAHGQCRQQRNGSRRSSCATVRHRRWPSQLLNTRCTVASGDRTGCFRRGTAVGSSCRQQLAAAAGGLLACPTPTLLTLVPAPAPHARAATDQQGHPGPAEARGAVHRFWLPQPQVGARAGAEARVRQGQGQPPAADGQQAHRGGAGAGGRAARQALGGAGGVPQCVVLTAALARAVPASWCPPPT